MRFVAGKGYKSCDRIKYPVIDVLLRFARGC